MKNNRNESVKEILRRKVNGIDCTEDESANLKMFIKETDNSEEWSDNMLRIAIVEHFPLEYGEALEELPEYLKSIA